MPTVSEWKVPAALQPKAGDYGYDLERALGSVLGVRAIVPPDAFTAETLGTERAGNGVLIDERGIVLTIGYLITEAETIWLTTIDGRSVPGHALAYDQETGFGLIQAFGKLDLPVMPLGESAAVQTGARVIVAGAGGRQHSVAARIIARQEFAGYWEYVLDEALFTTPAHPHWGGAALIGAAGELIGIGSLQLQQDRGGGRTEDLNMIVPIDLLKPIMNDMLKFGRPNRPARPWLGLYATEVDDRVVIFGLAPRGPAQEADLRTGDIIVSVAGAEVNTLAGLFRRFWSLGQAGVEVPLVVDRDGTRIEVRVRSGERSQLFKKPRLH